MELSSVLHMCATACVLTHTYQACVCMHIGINQIKIDFIKRSGFWIYFKLIIKIHRRALLGKEAIHIPWVHY